MSPTCKAAPVFPPDNLGENVAVIFRSPKDKLASNQLRNTIVVLVLVSLMFIAILYNGWQTLLTPLGPVFSTLFALLAAATAWFLARMIGSSEGGISKNRIPFGFLLVISAWGVFSWSLTTLEGKTIFSDTIDAAEDSFTKLDVSARRNVGDNILAGKETDFRSKERAFLSEVNNPENCGHGSHAEQRLSELRTSLPDLKLPSIRKGEVFRTQEECDALTSLYKQSIDASWMASPEGKRLDTINRQLGSITGKITQDRAVLDSLRDASNNNSVGYVLGAGRVELLKLNEDYKKILAAIRTYAPEPDVKSSLDVRALSHLGEYSQVWEVFTSRMNKISSYFYLIGSIMADIAMCHFFARYRAAKLQMPKQAFVTETSVAHLGSER